MVRSLCQLHLVVLFSSSQYVEVIQAPETINSNYRQMQAKYHGAQPERQRLAYDLLKPAPQLRWVLLSGFVATVTSGIAGYGACRAL
jgi:hypothetical protein